MVREVLGPRILEKSRYLAIIAVVFGLIAALEGFCWGAIKVVRVLITMVKTVGEDSSLAVRLVQTMDAFLTAAALLLFALAMYELFIGRLGLPEPLVVHSIDDLKSRLAALV